MTQISIERLTTGTEIYLDTIKASAQVTAIRFDGEGYGIDLVYGRYLDREEYLYVNAGGSVEFANIGEPHLRAESDVTSDEWRAKADAIDADILVLQGALNAAHGHVCREIDERPLVEAVAAAIGVPALMAAE